MYCADTYEMKLCHSHKVCFLLIFRKATILVENNQNTRSDLFVCALDGHKMGKYTEVLESTSTRLSKHTCLLLEFSFCIV